MSGMEKSEITDNLLVDAFADAAENYMARWVEKE